MGFGKRMVAREKYVALEIEMWTGKLVAFDEKYDNLD